MHDQRNDLIETIPASPELDALLDERDSILIGSRLDAEIAAVRAAEPRADTKAGNLQSLCSGLLLAGLAGVDDPAAYKTPKCGGWLLTWSGDRLLDLSRL